MEIKNQSIYDKVFEIIKSLYGDSARFREGQYEAIEATLLNKRTLVVQKTGWGKSLVYFLATSILRNQGKGVAMVVSPLLVLMENQIEAATKLGLKCDVLNSTVQNRRSDILRKLVSGDLDLLLVTPETLFKDDIQRMLKDISIGLFVIDEAHCISDWGHDFRLEYGNLYKIISILPENIPILATTATANDRVVEDLKSQLGDSVYVSRGPLTRESLAIQILKLKNKAERYGWILQNINKIPGSGIIYCLTQRDCDYLADFLYKNGVKALSYYSRNKEEEYKNEKAEKLFKENKIKVIVATIKLGMGYDKGDIGFVIHYQQPSNIVSYYQQIGRAGRNIEHSYAFLMSGKEDIDIINYFINTAFPAQNDTKKIIQTIELNNGVSLDQLCSKLNIKRNLISKALMFLTHEGFLVKEGYKFYLSANKFEYNNEKYAKITAIRNKEKTQMSELINTKKCYSKFIVNCLDDKNAIECGICSNCIGEEIFSSFVEDEYITKALSYINFLEMPINPRRQWAITKYTRKTKIPYINEIGICLSKYGDVGYGELVKRDKYSKEQKFCDELVGKSCEVLRPIIQREKIQSITFVPSIRSEMVEDFAKRLASNCGIKFISILSKREAKQQKHMENSSYQCENALSSFYIDDDLQMPSSTILVDDIVDSKWTLTVCGNLLGERGCYKVFPFTLADSSQKEI